MTSRADDLRLEADETSRRTARSGLLIRLRDRSDALADAMGQPVLWAPVAFAIGIGAYFGLKTEPPVWSLAAAGTVGLAALWCAPREWALARLVWMAVALAFLGTATAGLRAHLVHAPQLDYRYYGPIEGRVVAVDRSASDAVRLTLDRVALGWKGPDVPPGRVRVSLHGDQDWIAPRPGQRVMLTGHLGPPSGPAEPGGFDFRRHAFFNGIGAVGYTRNPVLEGGPFAGGVPVASLRARLSARIQSALPGPRGAVAAAILTGDRSGISGVVTEDLRASNLAHLLAISGLHMGLLAGAVFAALRYVLVWIPGSLAWPVKKIAAMGALAAAAGYLVLSGGNVAIERAFIMVAVMLGAVLMEVRALSLRAVALAALIILALRPEALLGPGFQMSFSATVALVAAFGALRDAGSQRRRLPAWTRPVLAVVLSSLVAGLATAPFAMAHFNRFAQFGLIANVAAVPLMGAFIMPAGALALLLMPLGLEALPLRVMGLGLDWILFVAAQVAALEGATRPVMAPPGTVLPLLALGGIAIVLTRGWLRLVGLGLAVWAATLWITSERPPVLIDRDGALVGVMTPAGRALSRESGAGFTARLWLENDGSALDQVSAAALWTAPTARTSGIAHVRGKRAAAAFDGCRGAWLVVSDQALGPDDGECLIFDSDRLRRTGAVVVWPGSDTPRVRTAREVTGTRLWHRQPRRRDPAPDAGPAPGQ